MLQFLQVTIHRETKRKEEEGRPEEVKIIVDDVGFKLVDEYEKGSHAFGDETATDYFTDYFNRFWGRG